jgi:chemotaxis protein methyltransferase CheR
LVGRRHFIHRCVAGIEDYRVMDKKTFDGFRQIVYEKAGININDNKVALVAARVGKRMRELSLSSDRAYLDLLLADESGGEIVNLLDVISTNVTSFFRESNHFNVLADIVGRWYADGLRKFRFWCAAASTGEEPYTMGMTILDALNGRTGDVKILATDISTRVLAKCQQGLYSEQKVGPVPSAYKNRFFEKKDTEKGPAWAIRQSVRDLVTFTRLNLSQPPFPMAGPFDGIFCRNVMIYFDNTVRKNLLSDLYRLVKPGGYLFVGHAESLTGILSGFKVVMPSVYVKE